MYRTRKYAWTYSLLLTWAVITLTAMPNRAAWVSLAAVTVAAMGTGLIQASTKSPPIPLPAHDPDDCPDCGTPKSYTTCQAPGCPGWCCWVCPSGPCDYEFDPKNGSCAMALKGEEI